MIEGSVKIVHVVFRYGVIRYGFGKNWLWKILAIVKTKSEQHHSLLSLSLCWLHQKRATTAGICKGKWKHQLHFRESERPAQFGQWPVDESSCLLAGEQPEKMRRGREGCWARNEGWEWSRTKGWSESVRGGLRWCSFAFLCISLGGFHL